ncbi:MAG: glycosyltransferase family 4 protein [Euryarchaeota archaeon]|nr:glycosyltransferase family 4 protein [Euryarchaeota archaeon]
MSRRLVKRGHSVTVVTKHFGELAPRENLHGVEVLRVRAADFKGLRSLSALPGMLARSFSLSDGCDILHAHIPYPSAFIACLVGRARRLPYVVTSQGSELLDYPEEKPLRLLKPLTGVVLRRAEHVHVISQALRESVLRNFGVPQERVSVIPNGVDLEAFNPRRRRKLWDERVVLSVSRLTPKNGLEHLIRAMKLVLEKQDCRLVIAGEGELRQRLEALVSRLGIESQVSFTGWVRYEDIPELLASSDVFARPSITEGLGTAFLEAMACGPVVGTKVSGIVDIVRHMHNGILVAPGDVEGIADAILRLLEDDTLRSELVANGLRFVRSYSWDEIAVRYEEMYRKVLEG